MDSPNTHSGGSIHSSDDSHSISPYFSSTPFHNNFDPLPNYFNSHNQLQLPPSTSSFRPHPQPNFTPAPQFPDNNNNTNQRPPDQNTRLAVRNNPKKRSRASRRAPTTVLTTDTTNFRAMVQEFTGIPAPPFSSSPFNRNTRFDLFPTPSNIRSNPLLLKPFPFKPQQQISSSTSLLNAISSTTNTNNNGNNLISDFTLPKPPSSLGMLNSFIQFDPPTQIDPTQKVGGPNGFGLNNGLPTLVSSDAATGDNQPNWVVRQGGGGGDNLRVINGNFDFSSSSKGSNSTNTVKVNYLASSSNFQGGNKGTTDHNVSSRSGGGEANTTLLPTLLNRSSSP